MVRYGTLGYGTVRYGTLKSSDKNGLSNVDVRNPKSTTFSHLVPVQRPLEIEEKNSKKIFLGICTGRNTLFLDLKNF
jgi:hypothetical protein